MVISSLLKNRKRATSTFDPSKNSGFTLTEILLVLFILSLVTALILPTFIDRATLNHDAKLVASMLRFLYDTTVSTKKDCFLKFDLQTKVVSYKCNQEERQYKVGSLMRVESATVSSIDASVVYVTFNLGMQDSLRVYLSEGDRVVKVYLNSITGKVKVSEQN